MVLERLHSIGNIGPNRTDMTTTLEAGARHDIVWKCSGRTWHGLKRKGHGGQSSGEWNSDLSTIMQMRRIFQLARRLAEFRVNCHGAILR
jgi:hypothetical protein